MATKVDVKKLKLEPVPAGHTMKYRHCYTYPDKGPEDLSGPKRLRGTVAWLENAQGELIAEAEAMVRPGDTPFKKLGRAIAHNRCIKAYFKNL